MGRGVFGVFDIEIYVNESRVTWDGSVDPMCLGFEEGNGRGGGGFCRAVVSTGRRGRTVERITGAREARA